MEKKEQKEKKKKKGEEQISKYRELLKGIQDKEKKLQADKDMEMEITWVPGTTGAFGLDVTCLHGYIRFQSVGLHVNKL